MMSDDDNKDDTGLTPDTLRALLQETGCEPVDIAILASMALVKLKVQAATLNPCSGTITAAVKEYDVFLLELMDQQPFDQFLLATHMKRALPAEWPLWINYTRNFYARFKRYIESG